MTREYATILELPHQNSEGRAVAELLARTGAKVVGEHRHPEIVERFTALKKPYLDRHDWDIPIRRVCRISCSSL